MFNDAEGQNLIRNIINFRPMYGTSNNGGHIEPMCMSDRKIRIRDDVFPSFAHTLESHHRFFWKSAENLKHQIIAGGHH